MKRIGGTILSRILLSFYCLSVLSLVFPFKIYKQAYLTLPVSNIFFIGLLLAGAFFLLIGITWKGLKIIQYEMVCLALWSFLLSIWYRFRKESGTPIVLVGIAVLLFLLYMNMKKRDFASRGES